MLMGVSSQKISLRLKRTVAHKATQTESQPWIGSESPSGPFVLSSPRKTAQDTLYVLPSPTSPCPSPVLVRKRAFVKWENKDSLIKSKEELRHLRLPTYQELEQVPSFSFSFFSDYHREVEPNQERAWKLKIRIRLITSSLKQKRRRGEMGEGETGRERGREGRKDGFIPAFSQPTGGLGSHYTSSTGYRGLPVTT